MTKVQVGDLAENIAMDWLRKQGSKDAIWVKPQGRTNFPIDIFHDHEVIEIKAGRPSNKPGSRQWRLTIGEPGEDEKKHIASLSAKAKREYNQDKEEQIRVRKQQAIKEIAEKLGMPPGKIKSRTITMVIDTDRKKADIFNFKGFHRRIGWPSKRGGDNGYQGTVDYK